MVKIRLDPRICKEIAADYGVSSGVVSKVKSGKSWHHMKCESLPKRRNKGNSKLSDDIAIKIRLDPRTCAEIAADYGVSAHAVSCVKSGKTWRHVK